MTDEQNGAFFFFSILTKKVFKICKHYFPRWGWGGGFLNGYIKEASLTVVTNMNYLIFFFKWLLLHKSSELPTKGLNADKRNI